LTIKILVLKTSKVIYKPTLSENLPRRLAAEPEFNYKGAFQEPVRRRRDGPKCPGRGTGASWNLSRTRGKRRPTEKGRRRSLLSGDGSIVPTGWTCLKRTAFKPAPYIAARHDV